MAGRCSLKGLDWQEEMEYDWSSLLVSTLLSYSLVLKLESDICTKWRTLKVIPNSLTRNYLSKIDSSVRFLFDFAPFRSFAR